MRLDKALGAAGYSRKQAKALTAEGRVLVDGQLVRDPSTHIAEGARVTLDGQALSLDPHTHFMIHKPAGILTATKDSSERTVLDLLAPADRRRGLGPVGRLDKDVTGLVLLTTDGQLAHRLISPRWEIEKVYLALVDGALDDSHVLRLSMGVPLKDFTARPAKLTILSSGAQSTAEIVVTEGKYHQVKRMFGALDRPVVSLHRRSIGGIELDETLSPGGYRALTPEETERLYALTHSPT